MKHVVNAGIRCGVNNMYKEDEELTKAIIIIILIAIIATLIILWQAKDEHDRIATSYAPDQTQPYESMEDELTEIERIVLENHEYREW